MGISYRDAGVDLESYEEAMGRLPALMQRTHTPRVMPLTGGFAGLFQLQGADRKYHDPVLVSGTDGVGTKIKVAQLAGRFDSIGIDLVAMCVNDCLCLGAEPLFFLDYLALEKDNPDLIAALVKGISEGCVDAEAALIGGETAIMPDLYASGDFDLAGFCVGVVEKADIIDGSRIEKGDILLGVESSGLHSNGFSLVRKAVFEVGGLGIDDDVPQLGGTVGELLLTPTRIYARLLKRLLADGGIKAGLHGIAHITGGGLADNIGRIIPSGLQAVIDRASYPVPDIFDWLQQLGEIDREEMSRVFNMGIGLTLVIPASLEADVRHVVSACGMNAHQIGSVQSGEEPAVYHH